MQPVDGRLWWENVSKYFREDINDSEAKCVQVTMATTLLVRPSSTYKGVLAQTLCIL